MTLSFLLLVLSGMVGALAGAMLLIDLLAWLGTRRDR
jgi:hypothetical protein